MPPLSLVSWNVNGIRAVSAKPDWNIFLAASADVVGLQETKAEPAQIAEAVRSPEGYQCFFNASRARKGYSGVAVFSKAEPLAVDQELPDGSHGDVPYNGEGRVLHLEFPAFHYFNIYFPNGGEENKRVPFKLGFYDAFLEHAQKLRERKPIVVCGDFNTSHKAIDLARPKENEKNTGFLPEERAWMDAFVDAGYVDTFRLVNGDVTGQYSWWSYKTRGRERNVGWRLDYFFVSEELKGAVRDAWIDTSIYGSDHCPVWLTLDV